MDRESRARRAATARWNSLARLGLLMSGAALLFVACARRGSSILPPAVQVLYPDLRERGAPDATLGAFGFKADDAFRLQGAARSVSLLIQPVTEFEYSETGAREAGLNVPVLRAKAGIVNTERIGYRLAIVRLLDSFATADSLNVAISREPNLRQHISGRNARLVDAVGIAYAYNKSDSLITTLAGTSVLRGDTLFAGTAGLDRGRTFTIKDGTILTYRLAKICWNARMDTIKALVPDIVGSSNEQQYCPAGTRLAGSQ